MKMSRFRETDGDDTAKRMNHVPQEASLATARSRFDPSPRELVGIYALRWEKYVHDESLM